MACKLIYNSGGQVIAAEDKNGNYSKVFQQILKSPFISSAQKAVEAYSNVYESGEEIPVTYTNNAGKTYDTYYEAIKDSRNGYITAKSGNVKLFSVSAFTNIKTFDGLINNLIKSNLIKEETLTDTDGKKLFLPQGNSDLKKAITSDSAFSTARSGIGRAVSRDAAGNLYFDESIIDKRMFLNKSGEVEYISKQEFLNTEYSKSSDPAAILASEAIREDNRAFGDKKGVSELEIVPENILQQRLVTLLQNMGVTITSIENYKGKYNADAKALADIANQIVAFKDGQITEEELTEETSHFIIEATDPAILEPLLRNVHKTRQWQEYSQMYEGVYDSEELLRKEILGKVLAESLRERFAQNQASDTANTIISKLKAVFDNFFNTIRSLFKSEYQQQLDQYTNSVYANLMDESLINKLNSEQLNGKKFTLYSLEKDKSKLYESLDKTITRLSEQQNELRGRLSSPANAAMLADARENIIKAIDEADEKISEAYRRKVVVSIANTAKSQINYLRNALNNNIKNKNSFAQEEHSVYENFRRYIIPALTQINTKLDEKSESDRALRKSLEEIFTAYNDLAGRLPEYYDSILEEKINKVIDRANMTAEQADKYREDIKNIMRAAQKDTAWFQAHFGQLAHAQNPLLNLLGDMIDETQIGQRVESQAVIKPLFNRIFDIIKDPKEINPLIGADGNYLNEEDENKIEALDNAEKLRIYNDIKGQNLTEFKPELLNDLTVEESLRFDTAFKAYKKTNLVTFYKQEYIDKLENAKVETDRGVITRDSINNYAQNAYSSYRSQLAQVRMNTVDNVYTRADYEEVKKLNELFNTAKSPYNEDGTLKRGIKREVFDEKTQTYLVELNDFTNLEEEHIIEALIVQGLQQVTLLNNSVRDKKDSGGISQSFLDKLNEFETEQEKLDFVNYNSYISFNDEFWNSFTDRASLRERLEESKDGENNAEIDELLSDIRTQQSIIQNTLKYFRVPNQPHETETSKMSPVAKNAIRDASIELEFLYSKANSLLGEFEDSDNEPITETRANESFDKDLEDSGENRMDYLLRHVTPKNKTAIEKAIKIVDIIAKGEQPQLNRQMQKVFDAEMSLEEATRALNIFAESKLLPYYKRTEPIGYSSEREALRQAVENNEDGAVEKYLINSNYVTVSPSFSFADTNENINPEWLANKEAGRKQYTKEYRQKIRNDEYFSRFAPDENGTPTKNQKQFELLQLIVEGNKIAIEDLGLTGRHNPYRPGQFHKSKIERFANLSKSSITETLKDMTNFRSDEEATGRDENGNAVGNTGTIKTIPMYGVRKLQNKEDVSQNHLLSLMLYMQQAKLYKHRKQKVAEVLAVEEAILKSDIVGKDPKASLTYRMAKSNIDANIYGQKENFSMEVDGVPLLGKVNLAKIAKSFNSFTKSIALSGITVPLTSAFQGKVKEQIENRIGEITNTMASRLADKEIYKLMPAAVSETLGLTSKAALNVFGETFGLWNMSERFSNAIYNKGVRGAVALKEGGFHHMGNFAVLPKIMMSVLYDYRYSDGKILTFNQYKRRNSGVEQKELEREWKKLPLFRDDITAKDGVTVFNREAISQKTGITDSLELDNFIKDTVTAVSLRINQAVQDIDEQIPEHQKSIAARDARFNFALNYMGWFFLALQRKTKGRQYNVARDSYEEGTWLTGYNLIKTLWKDRKDFRKAWNEFKEDEVHRRNLKRLSIELGLSAVLGVMFFMLSGYLDDEDDDMNWITAFTAYMFMRTATEQVSSTVALPRQFAEILENPIASFGTLKELAKVGNLFSGEEVGKGVYADDTKREQFIYKNVPFLKDYARLRNPKATAQSYAHFNEGVYEWTGASLFFDEEQ